jgi:hypothetical protein
MSHEDWAVERDMARDGGFSEISSKILITSQRR